MTNTQSRFETGLSNFLFHYATSPSGQGLLPQDHTPIHHTRKDSTGRVIGPTRSLQIVSLIVQRPNGSLIRHKSGVVVEGCIYSTVHPCRIGPYNHGTASWEHTKLHYKGIWLF